MPNQSQYEAPVFVSGGKRLNFTRRDEWEEQTIQTGFSGYGKDSSCYPSGSWRELCALATVIIEHPAYVANHGTPGDYTAEVEDA